MKKGYSLLELLIAVSIFLVLGVALAVFLRSSVINWQTTSEAAALDIEANALLSQIRNDLAGAFPRTSEPSDRYCTCVWNSGRPVITFSSVTPPDMESSLAMAGNGIDDDGDGKIDEEIPNGLDDDGDFMIDEDCAKPPYPCNIMYASDPWRVDSANNLLPLQPRLWRGIRWGVALGSSLTTFPDEIGHHLVPISDHVLFFEIRFGVTGTTTWDTTVSPVAKTGPRGPEVKWDAYRMLAPEMMGSASFPVGWRDFAYPPMGVSTPDEYVLPQRVLVILGMVPEAEARYSLARNITAGDTEIPLDTTDGVYARSGEEDADVTNVLLIGNEWVTFSDVDVNKVFVRTRGSRFSTAQAHTAGTPVWFPRVYSIEVYLPGGILPR
ncbi:MAG: prepilin-type N-terminal cleavage/methylation domain-containing protein [Candidatus Brocadiia bacterium]